MSSHALVQSPRTRRVAAAVAGGAGALALGFVGLIGWLIYSWLAGGECGFFEKDVTPGYNSWGDNGGTLAMFLCFVLWIVVGVFVLWKPGRVVKGLALFAVSCSLCLFVVAVVAPHIWDAPLCRPTDGGFF